MQQNGSALKPWHYALLALAALFCLIPGISSLPPIDRDEARFVQASKQMLETGDFIDIRFQDQSRYKKPVGIYWLQSAAVKLTGGDATSEIWRYRLVSVAAGIASALLIAVFGARMFGANAGLAAGIMLAGMLGLAFEGRIAKTDASLLAITLLAQTALAYIYLAAKDGVGLPRRWPLLLWVAIGIGILIKGPLTLLIAGLTIAGIAIFDKDRSWLRTLRPVSGLAIVAAISLPWLIAITLKSDGAFWAESVGKDMLGKVAAGQESHWGPPGYYLLTYSLYMWPFGFLAVLGGLKALNRWREPRILLCLAWYVPFWFLLELLPTKLPHYPLPAYPALLLLAGWALFGTGQSVELLKWQKWLGYLTAFGLIAVTLALAAFAAGAMPWSAGEIGWIGIVAAACALLAGWLALNFGQERLSFKRLIGASISAAAFYILAFHFVLPKFDPIWNSRTIATELQEIDGCTKPTLAAIDFHEPSLVFLTATKTKLTDIQGATEHLISGDNCAVVLLPLGQMPEFTKQLGSQFELQELAKITGVNYSKGRKIELNLVRLAR